MVARHVNGDEFQVDAEQLAETIRQYNEEICASGEDPLGKPAEYLVPLDTPPFYAVEIVPVTTYVYNGVVSDCDTHRCLDYKGDAIPGLYAVGDVSSMGAQGMPATGVAQTFLMGGDTAADALSR